MARLKRLAAAAHLHLVTLRGHNGQPIAADDSDRVDLIAALREAAAVHRVAVHAYAVLTCRLLPLLTPGTDQALGKAMQAFGRRYVAQHNRRHQRSGTLWEGRFRAALIEPGDWALSAMVHVDRQPQDSGLCDSAADFRWSSAAHHLGLAREAMLVDPPDYWALGNTPFEREGRFAGRLAEGLSLDQAAALALASQHNWAVGGEGFLAELAAAIGRPLTPRARGRPRRTPA
jgi:putative transposase